MKLFNDASSGARRSSVDVSIASASSSELEDIPSPPTPSEEVLSASASITPAPVKAEDDGSPTIHVIPRVNHPTNHDSGNGLGSPTAPVVESKKRKRPASPPWTFPAVATTTMKSADGRRISARFNTSETPASSENDEARFLSGSIFAARSRPASPPWKKFAAEGPSSVVVDGKRKSGRVHRDLDATPKRTSPRSKNPVGRPPKNSKSQTPATLPKLQRKSQDNGWRTSSTGFLKRVRAASSTEEQIAELQAQIKAVESSPPRRKPGRKRKHSNETHDRNDVITPQNGRKRGLSISGSLELQRSGPKLKLRFTGARSAVPPPHPNAQLPSPKRPPTLSISQRIDQLELHEMQLPFSENERGPPDESWFLRRAQKQASEEGAMRRKVLDETRPGGKLSREKLSLFHNADQQAEPPQQYGHSDHLVAHVLHLRHLQLRESAQHRNLAKKVAHEAVEYWKAMRGPTDEDIREQEDRMYMLIYKQVVFDIRAKWDMVVAYVNQQRLQQWEAEEERKRQKRLLEKLEWSENMVARQRGEAESESELDEVSTAGTGTSDTGDELLSEDEEGNMSEPTSEDESETEADQGEEMNEAELEAYLQQRDALPPDKNSDAEMDHITLDHVSVHSQAESDDDYADDVNLVKDVIDHKGTTSSSDSLVFRRDISPEEGAYEGRDPEGLEPITGVEQHVTTGEESEIGDGEHTSDLTSALRSRRSSVSHLNEEDDDLNLSSDESTNMDSENYDSDEDMSSTDEDSESVDDGGEGVHDSDEGRAKKIPLLGFYSRKDIKELGLPTPTTSAEGDDRDRQADPPTDASINLRMDVEEPVHTVEKADSNNSISVVKDIQDDAKQLIDELAHATEPAAALDTPASDIVDGAVTPSKSLVPSPSLLRGTLRSYQHAGLDWLASLYRNGTNGILADEMGLGKTIQTIALLAHLAEEHHCWESHLIIVPTSVILNWVTEFHKFLPGFRVLGYYGTAEERLTKRKGWVNDPHHSQGDKRGYNVVITSYNIAVQDITALRNVQWHCLVLDEAHNIRNFHSQRWQVLIRLKSRARLLLTGTPLQNSLTELWSLLTFLTAGDDDPAHGDLEEFLSHWREPVKEIFDRGVQALSNEAQRVVDQLHISLRPFLLRRLKTEVEKDLPKKTESVVVCKLSKRQRQLYQDYMGLAETKRSLAVGNAVSAGRVLLSLRRVCNHPDLFDPRPIQTSYAMEKSPLDGFSVKEELIRGMLGVQPLVPKKVLIIRNEQFARYPATRSQVLSATALLRKKADELEVSCPTDEIDPSSLIGCKALQKLKQRQKQLYHMRLNIQTEENICAPLYGSDLREMVTVRNGKLYKALTYGRPPARKLRAWPDIGRYPVAFGESDHRSDWLMLKGSFLQQSLRTCESIADRFHDTIVRFAFCTPAATAPILKFAIPPRMQQLCRSSLDYPADSDYAHEARVRTSIAFPDSRLLVYDSGKLQALTRLMRDLQARGSRSLIFTQMTGTLDILEQFLNLLNLPYLRLDGGTPVERRQLYSTEFNRPDSKYQCMILSSRAGGVGLNLTGASSVIFYDLDWNPQMDRQCMDRAHRIGQVRDVQVYKMVSERTVEENILRRANQKSLLDQTVIQDGNFTTEYQQAARYRPGGQDDDDEEAQEVDVAAAIDRFLGNGSNEQATTQALESVEDQEDVKAAQQARKEEQHMEDDVNDRGWNRSGAVSSTPGMTPAPNPFDEGENDEQDADHERGAHVDKYMIRHMQRLMQDIPFVPPQRIRTGPDRRERKGTRKR